MPGNVPEQLLEAEGEPAAKRLRTEATEGLPSQGVAAIVSAEAPPSQSSDVQDPNALASLVLHAFTELRAEGQQTSPNVI